MTEANRSEVENAYMHRLYRNNLFAVPMNWRPIISYEASVSVGQMRRIKGQRHRLAQRTVERYA